MYKYLLAFVLLMACVNPNKNDSLLHEQNITQGFTYQRADGNRWFKGTHILKTENPFVHELPSEPRWLLSGHHHQKTIWVIVLKNKEVLAYEYKKNKLVQIKIHPTLWESDRSPILQMAETYVGLKLPTKETNALPDTQYLNTSEGFLFLTGPTERYPHGVLGDSIEATGFKITGKKNVSVSIEPPDVIEGTSALWGDIDGDSKAETVVTLSNSQTGARLVAYSKDKKIAESEPIGQGNRWRHQVAIAPFGPLGEKEIVSVKTPHIGGVIEYFQLKMNKLKKVASLSGYSTHIIGSRNLDMAIGVDITGDKQTELIVPTQDLQFLSAIQRSGSVAQEIWRVPLHRPLKTNLSMVENESGIYLGAATETQLYIWGNKQETKNE